MGSPETSASPMVNASPTCVLGMALNAYGSASEQPC